MIYEVFLHLLQCTLTLGFRNDLPSFLEIIILDLVLEFMKHCSTTQFFNAIIPETSPADLPITTEEERIPIVHSLAIWKMSRGPRPEGQICSTVRSNSLVSNPTQRCRSNDYCPCRTVILCGEDLPGSGSSRNLRPLHQKCCFSSAQQASACSTLNCHF
ncbi:hypothetical protein TNCV_3431881 [Trichonephila clavipes]|nr:hypothetical protein TNCV_3431881 [Trichonephila clavipes]